MLNRLEYGKILIDILTAKLGKLESGYALDQLTKNLNSLVSQNILELTDPSEHAKVKALIDIISKSTPKSTDSVDLNLLAVCMAEAKDP